MPAIVILGSEDPELLERWKAQLPNGRVVLRYPSSEISSQLWTGTSAVLIVDAALWLELPQSLVRIPSIVIGEPMSQVFESARAAKLAKYFVSYDDSVQKLRDIFPLIEEIAEKDAVLQLLREKPKRIESSHAAQRANGCDSSELWDFLEAAVESMDTRERLVAEFRRASRYLLRASHVVFFLREVDGFRADRGTSYFALDDPLVAFFERHPAVVDSNAWDFSFDPVAEVAVKNRLTLWGSRLLVPVHDNGRLLGLIALGIRNDGQPYDEVDRIRLINLARLLRNLLQKGVHYGRLSQISNQVSIGSKYLPSSLILNADEHVPRHVPVVVRDLVGQARRTQEVCRAVPCSGQPFRAKSGIVQETGGVWAYWEEASNEVLDALSRERTERRELFRELSLTLSHELGNALVSLATFRQVGNSRQLPEALIETIRRDILQLESLNKNLGLMQNLHEVEAELVDIRDVIAQVSERFGLPLDLEPAPIMIRCFRKLLEYAFDAILTSIREGRRDGNLRGVHVGVRFTGSGAETTALLSISGSDLELEGVLPEYDVESVPCQGRLSIFLSKEILRMHNGEIHSGPGLDGVEILVSIRGT